MICDYCTGNIDEAGVIYQISSFIKRALCPRCFKLIEHMNRDNILSVWGSFDEEAET